MKQIEGSSQRYYGIEDYFDISKKCEGYCSAKIPDKICHRVDSICRNIKNCGEWYKGVYMVLFWNFFKDRIWKVIEEVNRDIDVY